MTKTYLKLLFVPKTNYFLAEKAGRCGGVTIIVTSTSLEGFAGKKGWFMSGREV